MIAFFLFIALQLADIMTTRQAFALGARELNAPLAWLMNKLGVLPALIVAKGAVVALVYLYALDNVYVLVLLCLIYCIVVGYNLRWIRQHQINFRG